jgi:hypothetical protein
MMAAGNATIQASLAVWLGHDYGWGLGIVVGAGAVCFGLLSLFGVEAKGISMAIDPALPEADTRDPRGFAAPPQIV